MSVKEARLRILQGQKAARGRTSIDLAILLRDSGALIGWIGCFMVGAGPEFRLGFWLGETYQAQGFMTETIEAALPALMKRLAVDTIIAETYEDNAASVRLLHRVGMQECPIGFVSLSNRPDVETIKFRTVRIP